MGKGAEENLDGIEIISVGRLYSGPWDKKYWSSSRGKDRYPYPVGYKSIRSQNGVTYEMEILEGPKGPSFTISSSDGKSCSGDTPDIAWESFQKKGCSRIKLWRGKRFSCKIDGVEFFGFKNTFVQRLLRELVANVNGTEQSLLTSNFSSIVSDTIHELQSEESYPNLLPHLEKTHVTGKRSRNNKVVDARQLHEAHFKHQREKCTQNTSALDSQQRDQLNLGGNSVCDHSIVVAAKSASRFCIPRVFESENLTTKVENGECLSTAERGMQLDPMDISDHLKVGGHLSQEEREIPTSSHHTVMDADDLPQNQEPIDRSRITAVDSSRPEEKDGVDSIQHDMPKIYNDADLCAPDTLDYPGDSFHASSVDNHVKNPCNVEDVTVNDLSKSEILVTDSHPEDEIGISASSAFSEKCDTDSVGQDIAKSMMTVLLPRALPLLKTFTRKRKKSVKPSVPQEENNCSKTSTDDVFIARELVEHLDLDRHKETTYSSSTANDSAVSPSGNTKSMVPDSFDCDDPQDPLPYTAKADEVSYGLDTRAHMPTMINGEATSLLCLSENREHKKNHHSETQKALDEKPREDTIIAPVKKITAKSKRARSNFRSVDKLPALPASTLECSPRPKSIISRSFTDVGLPEKSEASFTNKMPKDVDSPDLDISSSSLQGKLIVHNDTKDVLRLTTQQHSEFNSNLPGLLKLFARYVLPMPISMVQLSVKGNDIYICVKCDSSEHKESSLFVYKTLIRGENMGCPSLISHFPICLKSSKDSLGRDIAVDSSLLQFTPDAQSLVLINSIKTPYSREGILHCLSPACTSDCCRKNAVKIVQLNSGFVSLLTRLETTQGVCCLLVCEPSFLLAAEEGGKLKLWAMNSRWSAQDEDSYLPTVDCMFPCLVELKRVPKSAFLVVGHNGFGEFGLWDIGKRSLVSRFSSPGMSVSQCIPVSIFRWQRKGKCKPEELVHEIMDATNMSFTGSSENHFSPEDKDAAIWLLISTVSDPDSQCYQSTELQENLVRCWRLALLVNDRVIIGSAVDSGAAAVTSLGHGIIGRCDGLVYMWELSTGKRLVNLHSFTGTNGSCITTDTSNADVLAAASGNQLLIYLPS